MPDNNGAVDLGALSAEDQAALDALAEENPPTENEKIEVYTGFAIVLSRSGDVQAIPLGEAHKFALDQEPSDDLIYSLVSVVAKDVTTKTSATLAVQFQMQQAQAMAERMQAAQVAQGLDLSKLRQ